MNRKLLGRYIVTDPQICHGQPTFRGTRIMVEQVLEQVASGMAWAAIVEESREASQQKRLLKRCAWPCKRLLTTRMNIGSS